MVLDARYALSSVASNLSKDHLLPVLSQEEVESKLETILSISDEKKELRERCIDALHQLGYLVKIDWEKEIDESVGDSKIEMIEGKEKEREKKEVQWSVVLDPNWLANLLRTVVTIRDKRVNHGVIRLETLKGLWAREVHITSRETQEMMLYYLKKLDVVQSLRISQTQTPLSAGESHDDQLLVVPALLPDKEDVPTWGRLVSEVGRKNSTSILRVFLLEEGDHLPIEVMGRVHGVALRIAAAGGGTCISAWQGGCVVLSKGVLIQLRKIKVMIPKGKEEQQKKVQGKLHKKEKRDGVLVMVNQRTENGVRLFQRVEQGVRNVLMNFYSLSFRLVVPVVTMPSFTWSDKRDRDEQEQEGVIEDWFEMSTILDVAYQKKRVGESSKINESSKVAFETPAQPFLAESVVNGVKKSPLWLCPDLDFQGRGKIPLIERGDLDLSRQKILGQGSYGAVFLALWKSEKIKKQRKKTEEGAEQNGGGEIEREGEEVVVKLLVQRKEGSGLSDLLLFQREAYIMSMMDHPNVVQLKGIQVQVKSLLLVLEYLPGGNLLDQLIDPSGISAELMSFHHTFDQLYMKKTVQLLSSEEHSFEPREEEILFEPREEEIPFVLKEGIAKLERLAREIDSHPQLGEKIKEYLHFCEQLWLVGSRELGLGRNDALEQVYILLTIFFIYSSCKIVFFFLISLHSH